MNQYSLTIKYDNRTENLKSLCNPRSELNIGKVVSNTHQSLEGTSLPMIPLYHDKGENEKTATHRSSNVAVL